MSEFIHSVMLDVEKCTGCTNCVKRCPTEAIRIRDGKASIEPMRCIDCGECIRVCPQKAKSASFDRLGDIARYAYKIALPAPALYGQFDNLDDIEIVLNGLLRCGFDDVVEVSHSAEFVTEYTRSYLKQPGAVKPVISSACPAVARLIGVRFPSLCANVLPILAPVEYAARKARRKAKAEHPELPDDQIGVFFISPCPAKVSYARQPIGVAKSEITGVLSIKELYFKLVGEMKKVTERKPLQRSGKIGVSWAGSGGEASALYNSKYLAADGIENVIKVLEEIENGNFAGLEFVELDACPGGCVGGCLTVENPYIAKARLQNLRRFLPVSQTGIHADTVEAIPRQYLWEQPLACAPPQKLDDDMAKALKKLSEIERLSHALPGLDCGACGAPSCHALAEDIVVGKAQETDCIFIMRERINEIYRSFGRLAGQDNQGGKAE